MPTTLQQQYQQKKIITVQNKLKSIDKRLIESNVDYQLHLLLEALDENEYKEATEVIEKLTKLNDIAKNAGMQKLPTAIDEVIKEINKFTGGSGLSRFKGKISSLFSKTPAKNPILAGLAMVGSLEAGFKILPNVLKNNIPDLEKDQAKQKQKLSDVVTDQKVKKNIVTNLTKAFIPAGTFGKLFGKIPGINNPAELVEDLFAATPLQLSEFSKVLNAGTTVTNIDPNLADPKKAGAPGEIGQKGEKTKPAPDQQKKNIQILQVAAQKAGISDGKALKALMDRLEYSEGSFEAALTVPTLQKLMNAKNIPDDQTDGFIRGLMTDFDSEFKKTIQTAIDKEIEKRKKEKTASKPETSGGGSQLGAALGAG